MEDSSCRNSSIEEAERSDAEASSILKATRPILLNRDFDEVARDIYEACRELIGGSLGFIEISGNDKEHYKQVFVDGGGTPCEVKVDHQMSLGVLVTKIQQGDKVIVINEFANSDLLETLPEGHINLENVLITPLIIDGDTSGVMAYANKPRGFTDREAKLARAFGDIAAIYLSNRILKKTLKERVQAQAEELMEKELFEEIGRISSELAHDLRSPLQTINNSAYLMSIDPENKELINNIYDSVRYASSLLDSFREYYRGHEITPIRSDLHFIIEQALNDVDIPRNIKVEKIFDEHVSEMMIDQTKMRRAFNNLIKNAVEAMPDGGRLTIKTRIDNNVVETSIEDTGVGIPVEKRESLFKPFGSKKPGGSGLGLASTYRVVKAHNGNIAFESEVGKGTVFKVRIPISLED